MTWLVAAVGLCVMGVIAAAPFTYALMLFLGNVTHLHAGFWACLPAGFLLGALTGRAT